MSKFKKYKRKSISEMRPVDLTRDILSLGGDKLIAPEGTVSVSQQDKLNGSPKEGDMIARNPKNHKDLWLVAEKYFKENLQEI